MSISWAQGLLAGAAGVAEYSDQEQARRQRRLDRTTELQNQMRMHQAKSKYSVKLNEYTENRKRLSSLAGVEPGSVQEQLILHKQLGLTEKAAALSWKKGSRLQRPGALELPEFLMPSVLEQQASSPIQDWARKYAYGSEKGPLEQIEEARDEAAVDPLDTSGVERELEIPRQEFTASIPRDSQGNPMTQRDAADRQAGGDRFFDALTAGVPGKPTRVTKEEADPQDPNKVITWDAFLDPRTGEEMFRSKAHSRLTEEAKAQATARSKAAGTSAPTINNAISINEVDAQFRTGSSGNDVDYGVNADTPFNRSYPGFLSGVQDTDFFGAGADAVFSADESIKAARDMSRVSQAYIKANLTKITPDVLQQDPGLISTVTRQGEAFGILRTLPTKVIAGALVNVDSEKWTLNPNAFDGDSARMLGPLISFLSTVESPKAKKLKRELSKMKARAERAQTDLLQPQALTF